MSRGRPSDDTDQGGDPPCWAHLFDERETAGIDEPSAHPPATAGEAMQCRLQQQARALGDPTRHAIFRQIAAARDPLGVAELSSAFPFNHNAIRQHLAKLLEAGLIVEGTMQRRGPGRPRLGYGISPAAQGQWGTTGPYERLSGLLVEIIRSGDSPQSVGRRAAEQFRLSAPSADVVVDIAEAMARQGFAAEPLRTSRGGEIVLHECPFATTVLTDREMVCSLHLGIAEGLADGTDGMVEELIAYDPRQAGCRIRVVTPSDAPPQHPREARLTLRKQRRRGSVPHSV